MSDDYGARGHPNRGDRRKGFDYVAWAAMDLYGLGPDECTREQETEVYRAAKAECIRQGDWPDRQKYVPPVECMRGHQHKGKAPCSSCALIERQKAKREIQRGNRERQQAKRDRDKWERAQRRRRSAA